jgi:DNA ligase (NAD+)
MNIKERIEQLKIWDDAYYNEEPQVADAEYDKFREETFELDPDNEYFKTVGSKINEGEKVKHEIPMLSMNKAKTVDVVKEWLKKIDCENEALVVMGKVDGLSCDIIYEEGRIKRISTRGNGLEGRDISHLKDHIKLPKSISSKEKINIRGELVIFKDTKMITEGKPLRSLASGLTGRKEKLDDLKYLNFVSYQVYGIDFKFETEKIEFLIKNNFDVVYWENCPSIENIDKIYNNYLNKGREELKYETDGLVLVINDCSKHNEINSKYIVSHHFHHNIALKPIAESLITELLNIEWNVSRTGAIIPTAVFKEIEIQNKKISRASLFNYKNVKDLQLRNGAKVEIELANEVIPFFKSVYNNGIYELFDIDSCPICGSKGILEGVHIKCSNKNCPEIEIQKIIFWCQKSMEEVGEGVIRQLYNEGLVRSIKDLYHLQKDQISCLEGQGERSAEIIINEIQKSKDMTIVQFLSRLSVPLIGEKAIKKLGIKSIEDFYLFQDETYVIGKNLIEFKYGNIDYIKDLLEVLNIKEGEKKMKYIKEQCNGCVTEELCDDCPERITSKGKVCMTGKGPGKRDDLIKIIEDKGYEFVSSVNKETMFLICEDPASNSSKLQKAIKLSVTLMSYEEFFNTEE